MQIIRQSAFKAVPWRNGGGITHEAIRVPERGEPFRWRLSVARIEVSGPFSDFAGYRRTMVLLRGGGVVLRLSDGSTRRLRAAGDLAEFDGGLAVECELSDGPCVDLNLIASNVLGVVRARVERLHAPSWLPAGDASSDSTLVFPIDTALELQVGPDSAVLEPWDLALIGGSNMQGGARSGAHSAHSGAHLACRGGAPGAVFLATLA